MFAKPDLVALLRSTAAALAHCGGGGGGGGGGGVPAGACRLAGALLTLELKEQPEAVERAQKRPLGSAPARLLRPSSAPSPPRGAPGGHGQLGTPRPGLGKGATAQGARASRLGSGRSHRASALQVVEAGLALLEALVLAGAAREEAEETLRAETAAAGGGGGGGGGGGSGAPRSLWPAAAVRVAAGVCTSSSIEQAWVARLLHRLKQAQRDGPLLRFLQSHAQVEPVLRACL